MITKKEAIKNLEKLVGLDLAEKAMEFGITTFRDGKQNKGWKGLTIERLLGLSNNSLQGPDGLDFELKSVAFHQVRGLWTPKETMAITMINPAILQVTPFYESHCWDKLKSIIFCAVNWHGLHNPKSDILKFESIDFDEDGYLIREIEADYELIREKCIQSGFNSLSGRDGKWIQPRTKGAGHGSTSRAFYARKDLIKEIFKFD